MTSSDDGKRWWPPTRLETPTVVTIVVFIGILIAAAALHDILIPAGFLVGTLVGPPLWRRIYPNNPERK